MPVRMNHGFTLIELGIVLAIAAILLALAMPTMTTWLGNAAIRTNAEAISGAIQFARTEAIRRNAAVQMVMNGPGTSWTISVVSDSSVIQERSAEGRAGTVAIDFASSTVPTGATVRTLTFSQLGTITDTEPIVALKVDSATASPAASREMCVMVSTSGISRMCDPARSTANLEGVGATVVTKDPQSCQPVVPPVCVVTP